MRFKFLSVVAAALLAILTVGSTSEAFAQARPSARGQMLSVDPISLIRGYALGLQYESRISQDNSWAARLTLLPGSTSAFGVGASYGFYIADGRALTGLNIKPGVDLWLFNNGNASAAVFLIGADLGYKWIFDGGIGIEPYLWLRQGIAGGKDAPAGTSDYTKFGWNIGVWLGYAW